MLALEAGPERQRAFPGAPWPHRADAHGGGPRGAAAAAASTGERRRPSPSATATAWRWRRCSSPPPWRRSSTAATQVTPTLLARDDDGGERPRVVSAATSARLQRDHAPQRDAPAGTGRRAEAEGYRVGGKTGTAEMPGRGGYQEKAVISSFIGAFPMDAPKYVVFVLLFEPQDRRDRRRPHHGRPQRRPRHRPHRRAHRPPARRPTPPPRRADVGGALTRRAVPTVGPTLPSAEQEPTSQFLLLFP